MKSRMLTTMLALFLFAAPLANAQETLVIAGTGDSQILLRKLGAVFEKFHPEAKIDIPDSVGSGGGVKAVQSGEASLGRTARPLKDKEKPGLTEILFARSPVVFATNTSVQGVKDLSLKQILAIYSGTTSNWKDVGGPDAKIYPICREGGDSSRDSLEKNMPGLKELPPYAKEFFTTGETAEAIKHHKDTIGYLPLSIALENGLNVLAIEGQTPDQDNIIKGAYPYVTSLYLVKNDKPTPLALQFIDFVLSPEADSLMLKQGVMPLR